MDRKHAYSAPALLAPSRNVVLYSQGTGQFSPTHAYQTAKDDATGVETQVLHVVGMPVFRSGSFKDSMGELSTYETLHIDQMVSSYTFLKDQQIFPEVPVREGHGSFFGDPMTGLVGYHTGLRAQDAQAPDGETYRYLLADFTLSTQRAIESYLNGLWRNRSAEVGYYEANNGTGYYPVFQGFAFVDIPAVQFLNLFGAEKQRSFSVLLEKEIPMTAPAATPPAPQTVNPDGSAAPSGGNQPGTQKHAGNILPIPPAGTPAPGTPPPTPDPSPAPPTPTPTPAPGNFSFNCAGQQTSDFAAVQSYIAKLEADSASFAQFRAEQTRAVRVDFVKGLATEKKILASQIGETEKGKETGLVAVALGLSDEAFAQFSASYAALPVNPIFANQATGGTDPSNSDVSADEKAYAEAKSRVEWHRSAKRDEEFIKTTDSWKTYERLHVALGKPGSA